MSTLLKVNTKILFNCEDKYKDISSEYEYKDITT